MQALILAAGTGSRLGKYTEDNTKCMLKVNDKRLIDHALEILDTVGITKLILVVGYKKDNLITHVGNKYKNIEIEYVENPIYDKTNNIYSLYLAKDKLMQDDTVLLESDLIFDKSILEKLISDERSTLAVVDKYEAWMDGTAVTVNDNDEILNFVYKKIFKFEDVDEYYKTVNIYKFSKKFSTKSYVPFLEAYSQAMGDNEYYESVLRVITMLENQELRVLRLDSEKWYEIDDVQDKANAEVIFAETPEKKLELIQKRYGGYWRFPKLKDFCYLVNPYFPTPKMESEMHAYFHNLLTEYPSGLDTQNLLASRMFFVEKDYILVGNGASEFIRAIGNVAKGTFGIVFPTFNEYPESIGYNRVIKFTPKTSDFSYTIDDLYELSKKCDNLLLINPDNPSGHMIHRDNVLKLAQKLKDDGKKFILDESFVDFSSAGETAETALDNNILEKFDNLIVVKSISKSYGIPGARLGVMASSDKVLLDAIRKEIAIWNINSFGEFFLQIIGKYKADYKIGCDKIVLERNRFYEKLQGVSFLRVIKSEANYFLCEVTDTYTATELTIKLLDTEELYVKDLTGKIGIDGEYIRIAVKDYDDNNSIINFLNKI